MALGEWGSLHGAWPCWSFVHGAPTVGQAVFGTSHPFLISIFTNISQEALHFQMRKTKFKMFK